VCPRRLLGAFGRPLNFTVRPHMRRWQYSAALMTLTSLSGCIEITTYVSPSASGTVVDAQSQKPIEGATISVKDHAGLFTQTNAGGRFVLTPITRKSHIFVLGPYGSLPPSGTLVVSADGYALREIALNEGVNSPVVALQRLH
jgi:hypothetical protein